MLIGKKEFNTETQVYIMGILNVTPDSFSDGGRYNDIDAALYRVRAMLEDGADIIDIGGESTRPGYDMISDTEEIERISPIIESISKEFDTTISVDTYKSKVAKASIDAGANMINDIWGLKYDSHMAGVIAESGVGVCIMHNRENIESKEYFNFLSDVKSDIMESVSIAKAHDIADNKIMIDPGVGFAKTREQNLSIIRHLDTLRSIGYPILLGTSRKSVIGLTLGVPVEERLPGTLATTAVGILKGAAFVRVHDILENRQVADMTLAIRNS
ncbi:MAG: dihydropteroate synthase [Suipraeoptans sp.]